MDNERLLTAMQNILDNGLDADSFFELREAAAEYQPEPPAPQIIRTVEELEALDPDTILFRGGGLVDSATGLIYQIKFQTFGRSSIFPAVVVATGEQVRAAREALGGA